MIASVLGRTPRLAIAGGCLLALLALAAVAAPLLAPYDPGVRVGVPFSAPSAAHPLGTNDVGEDLLTELVFGARVSLTIAFVASLSATLIGAAVGLVAGYLGGPVDAVLMRLVDVVLSLPFLPLMIVIGAFLGPGIATLMLVIAAVVWAGPSRELRAQVLSARRRDHVLAAVVMGAPHRHILGRHLLPVVTPLIVPQFVSTAKVVILLEASLSFLGLGDPTARSWGSTLHYAYARSAFLTDAWLWWVLPAGACIGAAVLSFAFLGFALEQRGRPLPRPAAIRLRDRTAPEPCAADDAALVVEDLAVEYLTAAGRGAGARAVDGASLSVRRGETLGLVGESGCGKSTIVSACLGLLPAQASVVGGRICVGGRDLRNFSPSELRQLRGGQVGLIPQDALSALNPVVRVEDQIAEAVRLHRPVGRDDARRRARGLLDLVEVGAHRGRAWPHELSGGMRQRVVIAMSLAAEPLLLLADEPTTGLDVVLQAGILRLLADLRAEVGLGLLVVSHDLPVVLRLADRVAVMEAGRVVEEGPAGRLAAAPAHPTSRRLLASVPRLPEAVAGPRSQS